MLISNERLRHILGGLWLLDGLLQLQPGMFTMNLVTGIMAPNLQGQPAPVTASLHWIVQIVTQHLALINWTIALIQIAFGICVVAGYRLRALLIMSVIWALVVWYAGEGMGLLLTGQATTLSGAPGAVLLYALLALALYPRQKPQVAVTSTEREIPAQGILIESTCLLSRNHLRRVLAGFWLLAALLQLQPYWWQPEHIAQAIQGVEGLGTLSGMLVSPSLQWLADAASGRETAINLSLILLSLGLAFGLIIVKKGRLFRSLLLLSILLSLLIWWATEAFGMIFTGMATDVNSGPLVILVALACWPVARSFALGMRSNAPAIPSLPRTKETVELTIDRY
jgi:hypothetical protein